MQYGARSRKFSKTRPLAVSSVKEIVHPEGHISYESKKDTLQTSLGDETDYLHKIPSLLIKHVLLVMSEAYLRLAEIRELCATGVHNQILSGKTSVNTLKTSHAEGLNLGLA
jgi:hypothetical protein